MPRDRDFCLFILYLQILCRLARASLSPLVIAHRGDSSHLPEHCMAAYEKVITDKSADMLEVDLALTKDLKFVAQHEPMLGATTDVRDHPEFTSKKRSGHYAEAESAMKEHTDWWVDDFTLKELMWLRRVQRYSFRDQTKNGLYTIATLTEILDLVKEKSIPVMLEIKNPLYYRGVIERQIVGTNFTVEHLLVEELKLANLSESTSLIYIQTFYLRSALLMRQLVPHLNVIYLTGMVDKLTEERLQELTHKGIHGLGLWKGIIDIGYANDSDYKYFITQKNNIIQRAKNRYYLAIYIWTFRLEDEYLPWDYGQDYVAELERFYNENINGFITDFPQATRRFLNEKGPSLQSCGIRNFIVDQMDIILLCFSLFWISVS